MTEAPLSQEGLQSSRRGVAFSAAEDGWDPAIPTAASLGAHVGAPLSATSPQKARICEADVDWTRREHFRAQSHG